MQITGVQYTRKSVFAKHIQPILEVDNLAEALEKLQISCGQMSRLGIFSDMKIILDTSRDTSAAPGSIDVTIQVKEKMRKFVKIGGDVGDGGGSMVTLF